MLVIPNFTNYTISKDGVVRGNKIKTQTLGKNGYFYVTLYKNNTSKKFYIHRLLGLLYLPNPKNKRTINHIDGNKQNNKLDNLEWSTDSENIQHAHATGLNSGRSKITNAIRENLYFRFMCGETMYSISQDFPFNNVTVSNHIRRYVKQFKLEKTYQTEIKRQKFERQRNK